MEDLPRPPRERFPVRGLEIAEARNIAFLLDLQQRGRDDLSQVQSFLLQLMKNRISLLYRG